MRLEGIHHITAITGDAPRNLDFYTRVLGLRLAAKTVNQDDPSVYHLFYADEQGRAGSDITFFEYPGAPRGRTGAGHGPHDRVAGRRPGGDRLLGAASRRRGRRDRARRRRPALLGPRGPRSRARRQRDRATSRCRPSIPRSPRSTRSRASTPSARYSFDPDATARAARASARRRAGRRRRLGAARRAPRRHDTASTRRRRSAGCRARARSTTSRSARRWPTTRSWFERIQRAGVQLLAGHRPPLLPLDLLPRAGRRPLRDRRRRPRLHGRRAARGARLEGDPAADARAAPRQIEAILTPLPDPRAGWARTP